MKRRDFIALAGGAAAAWPLAARAQQPDRVRRIGVLMGYPESDPEAQAFIAAFRGGLRKLGWTEGRNTRIDTRWATPADTDSMQQFAKELVASQPDLILSSTTPTTAALLQQTRTIPIVFVIVADPVGSGFVASFPQPGGNVTGFVVTEGSLGGKWLELLKEIAPRVNRAAFLFNPATASFAEIYLKPLQGLRHVLRSGRDRRTCSRPVRARNRHRHTGTRAQWQPCRGARKLHDRPSRADHIAGGPLPPPYRLCVPFLRRTGGLLSYGVDLTDNFPRAAAYADRILKGQKPADLPVQAPVKYLLTINIGAAKALGLDVPPSLLALADEVIE